MDETPSKDLKNRSAHQETTISQIEIQPLLNFYTNSVAENKSSSKLIDIRNFSQKREKLGNGNYLIYS